MGPSATSRKKIAIRKSQKYDGPGAAEGNPRRRPPRRSGSEGGPPGGPLGSSDTGPLYSSPQPGAVAAASAGALLASGVPASSVLGGSSVCSFLWSPKGWFWCPGKARFGVQKFSVLVSKSFPKCRLGFVDFGPFHGGPFLLGLVGSRVPKCRQENNQVGHFETHQVVSKKKSK